jgi:hypothetical protein
MMTHASRLGTALVLCMGPCGAALAQKTTVPGAGAGNTAPSQYSEGDPAYKSQTPATPDTNAGMPKGLQGDPGESPQMAGDFHPIGTFETSCCCTPKGSF